MHHIFLIIPRQTYQRPKSAMQTRSFLGLVRYVSSFLPNLAQHSATLSDLITKTADKHFSVWTDNHQHAFDSIKQLLVSQDCLTTIDFTLMPEYRIYVTTDASNTCSGTVLSFGMSWETVQPVVCGSSTFKDAELNPCSWKGITGSDSSS